MAVTRGKVGSNAHVSTFRAIPSATDRTSILLSDISESHPIHCHKSSADGTYIAQRRIERLCQFEAVPNCCSSRRRNGSSCSIISLNGFSEALLIYAYADGHPVYSIDLSVYDRLEIRSTGRRQLWCRILMMGWFAVFR